MGPIRGTERKELGLSPGAAAKLLGLSQKAVNSYEHEYPGRETRPAQIPAIVEVSCRLLALQRRIFQLLKVEEGRFDTCNEQANKGASAGTRAFVQELRNLLFDTDLLLACVSQFPNEYQQRAD